MNFDEVLNTLTDEERILLEKIEAKLYGDLSKYKDSRFDDPEQDFSDKHPEILHSKHITNSPHEILITVTAEVTAVDNNGMLGDIKDLMSHYFHIPVKSGEDYSIFLSKFLQQFQETLEATCRSSIIAE
jgi:hypothetical protein